MRRPTTLVCACALTAFLLCAGVGGVDVEAQGPPVAMAAAEQAPPKDLRPLLQPRQSEMRLVAARYALDRTTLAGNYQGGMQQGRGGATPPPSFSPNRIARLKRFDLDWQAALARLDASRLSPGGRTDLDSLKASIDTNLKTLETETRALAEVAPLVPFAPAIVQMVEARIRIEDPDAQKLAGMVNEVARQVAAVRGRVEAGLSGGGPDTLRVGKDLATRGAAAVNSLQSSLTEWFTFYNGYDPLFTWWMGLPFKRADAALQAYATLLREKVAVADLDSPQVPAAAEGGIAAAPAPKFPSVPNLEELLALPQDEMTAIVQRFRGTAARTGGGRGGTGAGAGSEGRGGLVPPAAGVERGAAPTQTAPPGQGSQGLARDRAFYEAWLKALRTLDFDKLTRNAQTDYLYIRKMAEQHIARDGVTLPSNPPRKTDASGIPGPARGRQALIFDLQDELIPYTPEELIAIGERELAWCEAEMKRASAALGLADWKQGLEKVKTMHPPPGGQAAVVRDLMFEAVDFLRAKDLLNVPAVAAESLRMIMMTPERQLVNPFFTGGNLISVSYPTDTMEYEARIQSMRGNNTPFSHATAFHEMIPGHNLVFYMTARFNGYRPSLGGNSPFYSEGWPLYWEMHLYDIGFHDTPEKKVGALFWRMHRAARIIFSMKFHLGEWSPQECIDFLVDRVGFERDNATAEVRRSFQGGYGPLYQAAYLLGGLQLRGLRRELVDGGKMGEKAFHEEVLRQGAMPITLLRLALGRQKLTPATSVDWRFYN